jgi:hypothetical protein
MVIMLEGGITLWGGGVQSSGMSWNVRFVTIQGSLIGYEDDDYYYPIYERLPRIRIEGNVPDNVGFVTFSLIEYY